MKACTEIDRLSDLHDALLIHILSFLPKTKDVAATSVLSTRWRFLWKSVPLSLRFSLYDQEEDLADFITSTSRELIKALKFFEKIRQLSVVCGYYTKYRRYIDIWVYFATLAIVEDFTLELDAEGDSKYNFPQFAYTNSSLKNLVLNDCQLNPLDSVSWCRLVSLSLSCLKLTDNVMAKKLLHRLVYAKDLSLNSWCIKFLSKLEERGWQSPASSRKSLEIKTAFYQKDFSAICNLLQSSSKLETLVIEWWRPSQKDILEPMGKDKISKMFEKHVLDSSLLHLRTVKIITFCGPLSAQKCILPLVKHLLKNAKVLEKMVIDAYSNYGEYQKSVVSRDFSKMAQECLSFPRSSQNAVVVFSY